MWLPTQDRGTPMTLREPGTSLRVGGEPSNDWMELTKPTHADENPPALQLIHVFDRQG